MNDPAAKGVTPNDGDLRADLRRSEARYRALQDVTNRVVWSWSPDGTGDFAQAQRWWEDLTGQSPEKQSADATGWLDLVHPDDRAAAGAAWGASMAGNAPYDIEYRVRARAGGWRQVHARGAPVREPDGAVVEWVGTLDDVTDRKRAEEDLVRVTAESDRRRRLYETVLSSTPDFVYVFSLDHRVLYVNDALGRMWGHRPEDTIGKTFLELGYEPWHAEMHGREIDQVRETRKPIRGEVPFNGTHGRRIYDYIFVPVLGADGEVEAVAGTTRDVTDRKAMEDDLRESDRKKDDFIALLGVCPSNPVVSFR